MSQSPKCFYCARKAKFLCDFVLWTRSTPCKQLTNDMTSKEIADVVIHPTNLCVETCDRPLCDRHRVQVGVIFFCGDKSVAGGDTRDMCPGHARVPDGHKPRHGVAGGGRAA